MSVKSKLNSIEVLISQSLIDQNISHDEFALINNGLKEYDYIKEKDKKFKDLNSLSKILSKFRKNIESKYPRVERQKTEE